MKYPLLLICLLSLAVSAFAAHNPNSALAPAWSAGSSNIDYTVTLSTVIGDDPVDEIRIIKSIGYTDFSCEDKSADGWHLIYVPVWYDGDIGGTTEMCWYYTTVPANNIPGGGSETFDFSATVPADEGCNFKWKFETRDEESSTEGDWETTYAFTNIDSKEPTIEKTMSGGQTDGPCPPGQGEECWMNQKTTITACSEDQGDDTCVDSPAGPANTRSGVDYCDYTLVLDGSLEDEWTVEDNNTGDDNETPGKICHDITFDEDSLHELTIECYDKAGNKVTDTEYFRVDDTPPETTKWFNPTEFWGDCWCWNNGAECEYINLETEINLDAVDPDPTGFTCNIGVEKTYWYNSVFEEACNNPCEDQEFQCRICEPGEESVYCVQPLSLEDQRWTEYTGPFTKDEESCHVLQYYSVDKLGNTEDIQINCFYVDARPPVVEKVIGDPVVDGYDPSLTETKGVFHWVTPQTDISFTCTDQEPHPSREEKVCFKVSYDYPDWGYITESYCEPEDMVDGYCCVPAPGAVTMRGQETAPALPFVFRFHENEESLHNLEYFCVDAVGNKSAEEIQYYRVDETPPEIVKTMIGTDHLGDCPPEPGLDPTEDCYVRDHGENGVHVAVSDPDPTGMGCNVDNTECLYTVEWKNQIIDRGLFGEDGVDIIFTEDSTHILRINCEDELGNKMLEDVEVFLVDSTPPETTKAYGSPTLVEGDYRWITSNTPISFTAEDAKVGVDTMHYRITWLDTMPDQQCTETCKVQLEQPPAFTEYTPGTEVRIPEESCHYIEFYSVDKLRNTEEVNSQCVFVDNSEPGIEKVVGDPQVDCEGANCEYDVHYYITRGTPITITCKDVQPHPVNHSSLSYRYRVSDDCATWGDWTEWDSESGEGEAATIYFPEDSCHELEYKCVDYLGNTTDTYTELDVVDTVGPVIVKEVIGPQQGDCPPEQGTEDECYIDGITEIHVDAYDPEPHPVNDVYCDWDYEVIDGQKIGQGGQGVTPPFVINFPEESEHVLTITCYDALRNETVDIETFYVDKTPPAIWKEYDEETPMVSFQFKDYWAKWINSTTKIYAGVEDAGPHKTGIADVKYRISLVEDDDCKYDRKPESYDYTCDTVEGTGDWTIVDPEDFDEFMFSIGEESCHLIEIMAADKVDKCSLHKQWVYVDNTAPTPIKTVGEPKDLWTPGENGDPESYFYPEETEHCWDGTEDSIDCWEVTTLTPINMDCEDPEPHPVDHETVCFNVELDGEDWTGPYCSRYRGRMKYSEINEKEFCCLEREISEFYFREDSEHELEYYCVDALGNNNEADLDIEKFKVEGTKFEIPLFKKWNLISVPFALLSDAPEDVFTEDKGIEGVDSVWTYDPSQEMCGQDWCVFTPDGEDNDNLDSITPGWGYWVMELLDEEWLTIGGSLFSTGPVSPPSHELEPGWNLIGYYGSKWQAYKWSDFDFVCGDNFRFPDRMLFGDQTYCALNSLVDTQEGYPRWSSLWSYINCGNHHSKWVGLDTCANEHGCTDRMYAGRGYWIEIDVEDMYAPATTCIWNDQFDCVQSFGGIF